MKKNKKKKVQFFPKHPHKGIAKNQHGSPILGLMPALFWNKWKNHKPLYFKQGKVIIFGKQGQE